MMTSARPSVLLLGLDGATFDIINPLIGQGSLPNLARLIGDGFCAPLKSTIMPNSYPAWVSLTTGVNPGKHGIFWPLIRKEEGSLSLKLMSSRDIRARRIWHYLGDRGYRVAVFNVPTEYPPEPVNGLLVCGALTPDVSCPFTYPRELKDEILRITPGYRCEIDYSTHLDKLAKDLISSIEDKEKTLLYLLKNKPWDFFMAVFTETDLAQHKFWAGIDERHPGHPLQKKKFGAFVHDVYRRLDEAVGKTLASVPEGTTVLVVSDHGFGAFYQSFSLPKWLEDEGYLALKKGQPAAVAKSMLKRTGVLKKARALRAHLSSLRSRLGGRSGVRQMREKSALSSADLLSRVHWERTKAYYTADYGIRLNLKGREPLGVVSPGAEQRSLENEIRKKLGALTYSNGQPVFEAVMTKDEAFSGPLLERAPDLIVPVNYALAPPAPEGWPYTLTHPSLTGTHAPLGIFIARGEGIPRGRSIGSLSILDIAPTVLSLFQLPPTEEMEGRVLAPQAENLE